MAEMPVTTPAYRVIQGDNLPIIRIVWHTTQSGNYPVASAAGVADNVAGYFQRHDSGGSAQYITDIAKVLHVLSDNTIAWGAPPNPHELHIEICGNSAYTREQWLSPQVWPAVQNAINLAAELSIRCNVPVIKIGPDNLIAGHAGHCGHVDVSNAWHQTDHTDPGPNFPWDLVVPAVKAAIGVKTSTDPAARPAAGVYTVKGMQSAPGNPGFNAYLQHRLGIPADGSWGPQTTRTLAAFQTSHGLAGDAVIGAATAAALGWAFRP